MSLLEDLALALQSGDDTRVPRLTADALEAGVPPQEVLDGGLIAGMAVVGRRFRDYEIFLPDVLLAARAMDAGVQVLKPHFLEGEMTGAGTVVLGTVRGDLHDIGKNLVGIMLKGAGFKVVDLGKNVAPAAFIDAALEHDAQVIGMSALLTTTAPMMAEVTGLLKERGLGSRIRTIAGGAPMSRELATDLGADAYAFDATSAVERIQALVDAPS
ncbi:MAG: corrinoid protein [Gemmatimonadota bacterium]|nr:corrinoid protein [Gemmatimonadota bacterium]